MKHKFLLLAISAVTALSAKADDGSSLWMGRYDNSDKVQIQTKTVEGLGEGYIIEAATPDRVTLSASSGQGLMYGEYAVKRLLATGRIHDGMSTLKMKSVPAFRYRILNHWDNLDGSIERGYAGRSIFWNSRLKGKAYDERIIKYAQANASIGINGAVLNNVNASPETLTKVYIDSVRHIADLLRPFYVKVWLSVNFASPKALGATETADPLDASVRKWWAKKVKEIYKKIPDFGGFLVKANSEGQPGPFDYGRTHADGANMLADALKPYGGVVIWRSFVYGSRHKGEDRVMQAVSEFKDLDGLFRDNVILQSKNGPLDFQPREPYAPIFDNIRKTTQMVEFQIAHEYTGQALHLVYLAPMWKEFFTYCAPPDRGEALSPSSAVEGRGGALTGIAGVSNIGDDANWCHHDFSQANWYAFGRLAWDPELSADEIADEWIRQTFTTDTSFIDKIKPMMLKSREYCVDYMMPLGLHHIFAFDHHYGPEPGGYRAGYPVEWCPVYYHKADSTGIGFDRSSTGTNAVGQYREPYRSLFDNIETCPDKFLLWFHRVPWTYEMRNGLTLWDNLCLHYRRGVDAVAQYQPVWESVRAVEMRDGDTDGSRWQRVDDLLKVQLDNAKKWRDTCLGYFGSFVKGY